MMEEIANRVSTNTKYPDFLCYYFRNRPSFRSVLDKGESQAKEFLSRHDTAWRCRDDYIGFRLEVEAWVRAEFIRKGGQPKRVHPIYLSLGIEKILEKDPSYTGKLILPLHIFTRTQLSLTYLDSMHTAEGRRPIVFMKDNIVEMIDRHGSGYNEVQVWDDAPLSTIREQYLSSGKLDYR